MIFSTVPAAAEDPAAGDTGSGEGITVRTEGETKEITVGDITSTGVGVNADNQGGTLRVTTGDVSSQEDGVQASLTPRWENQELTEEAFSAAVAGISSGETWVGPVYEDGSYMSGETWRDGDVEYYKDVTYGPDGMAEDTSYGKRFPQDVTGSTDILIDGNVTAVAAEGSVNGVSVDGNNTGASGSINVTVTGDVSAAGAGEGSLYGSWTNGVYVSAREGITATVAVGGNVSAVSGGEVNSVSVHADNGAATVTVGGDVTAKGGSEWDHGLDISASGEKGKATVQVGNITGDETGVLINLNDGMVNLTTGSVTAKNSAITAYLSGEWIQTELTEEEFAALDLGDPHSTHIADLGNGETRTIQSWSFDEANYRTETYDGETIYFRNAEKPSDGAIAMNINGSVTAYNENGGSAALNVSAGNSVTSGDVKVNVNGDISATGAGRDDAMGVAAHAGVDGSAVINVDGSISVVQNDGTASGWGDNASGIDVGTEGGLISVTVAGDVDVTSLLAGKRDNTVGVRATTTDADAEVNVTVNGDITVSGENASGVTAYIGGGEITVDVNGNIVSGGNGISASDGGYAAWGNTTPEVPPESETRIAVFGDVTADDYGAYIEVKNDKETLDLLVDGTLSGDKSSILLNEDTLPGNVTLTVWEVKKNENGSVADRQTYEFDEETNGQKQVLTEDKEFEKQIQYIIRVEQPEVGSVATNGTTKYEGYDVAHEDDTVTLKVTVPDGYRLADAFNGTDTKVQLLKDADGNFYLVVPRGGAVTLSVKLEKVPEQVWTEDDEEAPAITVTPVDNTPEAGPGKMDDTQITAAVEELLTKNGVLENSTVTVGTDASGVKTVIIAPETIESGEESTVLQLNVPAEMLTRLADSDVKQITMVSKSGTAQVTLDTAAVLEEMSETTNAKLIVNIEENSESIQNALQAVPARYTAKADAVAVTARIVNEDGTVIVLDSSANISIRLNIDFEEGMKILFVDEDGNIKETEAVWVEATEDVPAHWEVPFLGEGAYIPVVEEEAAE